MHILSKSDYILKFKTEDKNNCMYFVIKEEKVFRKYNEVWENVSKIIYKKII